MQTPVSRPWTVVVALATCVAMGLQAQAQTAPVETCNGTPQDATRMLERVVKRMDLIRTHAQGQEGQRCLLLVNSAQKMLVDANAEMMSGVERWQRVRPNEPVPEGYFRIACMKYGFSRNVLGTCG